MSRELTFEISRGDKAILKIISADDGVVMCLVDTGANTPVWFMGENFLKKRYPESYKTDKHTIIRGLGENPLTDVPVWIIPKFIIEDDEGKSIVFHNLYVPVVEISEYSFNMIIPLTMLNRTVFTFDYVTSANRAFLRVETEKDSFYTRPIYAKNHPQYLNKIQVFYQDEEN